VPDVTWGVDLSTKSVAVAEWLIDADEFYAVRHVRRVAGKRALGWPDYLLELGEIVDYLVTERPAGFHPVVLGVEQPIGRNPNPRLTAAWGVILEHFRLQLPRTLIWDYRPQAWRGELGLKGNARKHELLAEAVKLGYVGHDENEGEACLIARATASLYRRSGPSAAPTAGAA
jgi:hypothetical protein